MDLIVPILFIVAIVVLHNSYLLYRSRPPQQMAAVVDYSTVDFDRHLVYLLRQSYRTDEVGCPAGADCRSRDLYFLNVRLQ